MDYLKISQDVGKLVKEKQLQYGDSVGKSVEILRILYPGGIKEHQYQHLLLVIRILDKICRLAGQGPDGVDKGGESPYRDIAGYAILGLSQ